MTHRLYCDPSSVHEFVLRYDAKEYRGPQPRADQILKLIDDVVQQQPIDELVIVNRAHAFTILRVVVTIVNALAFSQKIPLAEVGNTTNVTYLKPHYSAPPKITL